MDDLNVLITGAGAPGIAGSLYSLRNNYDNRKLNIIGTDVKEDTIGKYLCDKTLKVPYPQDETEFINELIDICKKEEIDVILPQVTNELLPLSKNKKLFNELEDNKNGTKIAISSEKSIKFANDKFELIKTCKKLDIPYPECYLVKTWDELEKAAEKLEFPFIVKPPVSNGMRGFRVIHKEFDQKKAFYNEKPNNVNITIAQLYDIIGDEFPELIATEYLPNEEYTIDIFSGTSNNEYFETIIPRKRDLIRSGITFNGTVEKNNDLIEYSQKLIKELNLEYCTGLQFKLDKDNVPKILESNPRIQGTMVMSTLANANIIYSSIKMALDEKIPSFDVQWNTKFYRYWGGIGVNDLGEFKL
ncbi:ATP-grasp domain-containing protein [Methanococcus voltae]|uniref:ATP-grasp domain-containing protein n=1 Tax=Methanococcus voltae (strain ATCC BAA-1334 / A3) TaxID=456320 RepID=D7DRZ5_METV3|nr:ATP-grasp domain-containing protein [Methanococcus voltae]MCS3901430.1 carbamoyl-phosphate synthase large subunit [Methanococcus voltae]